MPAVVEGDGGVGNVQLTTQELAELLDRAAKRGAKAAFEELGFHDPEAVKDLTELRSLLSSWRETKRAMWSTAVKVITTAALAFIAGAVALYVRDNLSGQ